LLLCRFGKYSEIHHLVSLVCFFVVFLQDSQRCLTIVLRNWHDTPPALYVFFSFFVDRFVWKRIEKKDTTEKPVLLLIWFGKYFLLKPRRWRPDVFRVKKHVFVFFIFFNFFK
jgi:hypothetical protein